MRPVFRFPSSSRPPSGRASVPADAVVADEPALDDLVAALTAGPAAHELDGFGEPRAAYMAAFSQARVAGSTTRRTSMPFGLRSARTVGALAGAALGLSATAVAVGLSMPGGQPTAPVLPAAATAKPSASPSGTGPDATGPAAHGLCTAWSRHQANGSTKALDSPPMRNLAAAAGGAAGIEAYCAGIEHPGKGRPDEPGAKGKGKGQEKDKGKPERTPSSPKAKPTSKPSAKPSRTSTPTPSTSPSASVSPSPSQSPSPGG